MIYFRIFYIYANFFNNIMPLPQNHGPCSVNNCDINTKFRRFTKLAYEKAQKKGTFNIFNYLKIGDQLCQTHYNNIVEPDRNKCKNIPLNDFNINFIF